ncbi:Hypothetical predicted protein [Podarcis lilfordi]|uniref:Secreted protein n=1 Tax=Podarcis lilfordi TaxID=74358 RepID=A0AA35KSX1_9SAUR|nr:Hypothetical predicted protein [Podarcis lilfordi]
MTFLNSALGLVALWEVPSLAAAAAAAAPPNCSSMAASFLPLRIKSPPSPPELYLPSCKLLLGGGPKPHQEERRLLLCHQLHHGQRGRVLPSCRQGGGTLFTVCHWGASLAWAMGLRSCPGISVGIS